MEYAVSLVTSEKEAFLIRQILGLGQLPDLTSAFQSESHPFSLTVN